MLAGQLHWNCVRVLDVHLGEGCRSSYAGAYIHCVVQVYALHLYQGGAGLVARFAFLFCEGISMLTRGTTVGLKCTR